MNKLFISLVLVFISFQGFGQEFITDDNFDAKINEKHAFGDDDQNIVVVEFWAKFNEANAFADWEKVEGVKYFRMDVGTSPIMKKKYRIRMAPTLIVFNKGIKETTFKAGLDLECPVELDELQEAIEEVKTADKF
tara:strand:- start:5166 stop:5570 length:405 start_codon:yes stop_codon:yes gene_type:complete